MRPRTFVLVVTVFLGMNSERVGACSYAAPSVSDAVQNADIVAVGRVDSITANELGIIQSAVFVPDRLLKGSVEEFLRLDGSSLENRPCAGDAVRPYASGERVMMMLSEDENGSFEPPIFPPMLMHVRDGQQMAEQRLSEYVAMVISGTPNPIEVQLRCQPQYALGEVIEVRAAVTNHLSIPAILSNDIQQIFDLPVVRVQFPDLGYEDSFPNISTWVIPAKSTREARIVLQDYFESPGEGKYFVSTYVDLMLDRNGQYWDDAGPASTAEFSVTTSTVTRPYSWGETKEVLLGK